MKFPVTEGKNVLSSRMLGMMAGFSLRTVHRVASHHVWL